MKTLFAAAVAVSMLTGTVTTAYADNDRGRHQRHYDHKDRRDHHGHHDRDHNWDRRDAYRHGRADQRRYDRGRYIAPRGYYVRSWRHGDYLPRSYYERRYIVHDYHVYHLSPPPRGHHWVRVNNDVILAAVASGLVVSVVNGLFY
ncbi:MAG TPA: RcnB family protein [Steroidobacter sp.]|uniref:RcnB family protein n=1 Tax=Steroidobacter sp. TaxID=1978227 RepID=UPI002EDA92AF